MLPKLEMKLLHQDNVGSLIIISGPSGIGKGVVIKKLLSILELNLVYSVSYTTRKPRLEETNHVDYTFINKSQFRKLINQNYFLEYCYFFKNYYGTPRLPIIELLNAQKNVVLEIEPLGAEKIITQNRNNVNIITIFLNSGSLEETEKRLVKRKTETPDEVLMRLKRSKKEIEQYSSNYDIQILNHHVADTVFQLFNFLKTKLHE